MHAGPKHFVNKTASRCEDASDYTTVRSSLLLLVQGLIGRVRGSRPVGTGMDVDPKDPMRRATAP